jgi:cytokinin riboside 5'-monophosphate phosphoribohydrolase
VITDSAGARETDGNTHQTSGCAEEMRRICVFTGTSLGKREEYQKQARELGRELVKQQVGLVYGGANVGLMGILADTVLTHGGEVIGVTVRHLWSGKNHDGLTALHTVESLSERKALMARLSDGFTVLPGGFGTYDEFFEMISWTLHGIQAKPLGLLNVANYFSPFLALVTLAIREGFIMPPSPPFFCEESVAVLVETMMKKRVFDLSP